MKTRWLLRTTTSSQGGVVADVLGVVVEDFGAVGEEPAAGQGVIQAEFPLQCVDCRPDALQWYAGLPERGQGIALGQADERHGRLVRLLCPGGGDDRLGADRTAVALTALITEGPTGEGGGGDREVAGSFGDAVQRRGEPIDGHAHLLDHVVSSLRQLGPAQGHQSAIFSCHSKDGPLRLALYARTSTEDSGLQRGRAERGGRR
ncbi:hypothetical protein FE391_00550 [Nonomuraea sp. KC401]|nr:MULTISPECIES: hypothetical protein [unclassified Nonomuraea]NBE91825.1 hypothetical protein [Nonomuraea sp. K271]TLF86422.1 hypothetical protein FE391_00550 [Nonomuraea sp. KC401]